MTFSLLKAQVLLKAAQHKYTHRKLVGRDPKTGRKRYRYYYAEHHGGGITSAEIEAGSAFKLTFKGRRGHFHVQSVEGDVVTVRHDGRPNSKPVEMTKAEFRALLKRQHETVENKKREKAQENRRRGRKKRKGSTRTKRKTATPQTQAPEQTPQVQDPEQGADNLETMDAVIRRQIPSSMIEEAVPEYGSRGQTIISFEDLVSKVLKLAEAPPLTNEAAQKVREYIRSEVDKLLSDKTLEGYYPSRPYDALIRPKKSTQDPEQGADNLETMPEPDPSPAREQLTETAQAFNGLLNAIKGGEGKKGEGTQAAQRAFKTELDKVIHKTESGTLTEAERAELLPITEQLIQVTTGYPQELMTAIRDQIKGSSEGVKLHLIENPQQAENFNADDAREVERDTVKGFKEGEGEVDMVFSFYLGQGETSLSTVDTYKQILNRIDTEILSKTIYDNQVAYAIISAKKNLDLLRASQMFRGMDEDVKRNLTDKTNEEIIREALTGIIRPPKSKRTGADTEIKRLRRETQEPEQGADNFETMPEPDPSPAREQLTETAREVKRKKDRRQESYKRSTQTDILDHLLNETMYNPDGAGSEVLQDDPVLKKATNEDLETAIGAMRQRITTPSKIGKSKIISLQEIYDENEEYVLGYSTEKESICILYKSGEFENQVGEFLRPSGAGTGSKTDEALSMLYLLNDKIDLKSRMKKLENGNLDSIREFAQDLRSAYDEIKGTEEGIGRTARMSEIIGSIKKNKGGLSLEYFSSNPYTQTEEVDKVSPDQGQIQSAEDLTSKERKILARFMPKKGTTAYESYGLSGIVKEGSIVGAADGGRLVYKKTKDPTAKGLLDPVSGEPLEEAPVVSISNIIPDYETPALTFEKDTLRHLKKVLSEGGASANIDKDSSVNFSYNQSTSQYDITVHRESKSYKVASIPATSEINKDIRLRAQFLLDALKIAGDRASFSFAKDRSPARIDSASGFHSVVMPMRVQEPETLEERARRVRR